MMNDEEEIKYQWKWEFDINFYKDNLKEDPYKDEKKSRILFLQNVRNILCDLNIVSSKMYIWLELVGVLLFKCYC